MNYPGNEFFGTQAVADNQTTTAVTDVTVTRAVSELYLEP